MNLINSDYKDWYLKCRFEWLINETTNILSDTLLILSYNNSYLKEYLNSIHNVRYILRESLCNDEFLDKYSIIVILNSLSENDLKIIEDNSKKYNYQIWNVYQKYIKYEKTKTPVNYIVDEFNTLNYEKYTQNKDRLAEGYIRQTIKKQYSFSGNKLFNKVEIETISKCNSICSFCPVNRNNDTRAFALMDKTLYKSIIDQLADLNYDSCIALFSNNEPLLDKRILFFAEYAKNKLPNNFMYIYTNGILLTRSYLNELLKYFDHIYINNYNDKKILNNSIFDIWKYLQEENIDKSKVTIHLRDINEKLSSRAGTAPNRNDYYSIHSSCLLPFNQLSIRANGKVSLCSIDALCQIEMGDLNNNSIIEIWNSPQYKSVREALLKGREQLFPCKNCDMLFTTIPFEKVR